MMSKSVSGTIMLSHPDGRKEFFVEIKEKQTTFPIIEAMAGKTALGSLLTYFTETLEIDAEHLSLVELNSVSKANNLSLPFYVFETTDLDLIKANHPELLWKSAKDIDDIFKDFEIAGVPIF